MSFSPTYGGFVGLDPTETIWPARSPGSARSRSAATSLSFLLADHARAMAHLGAHPSTRPMTADEATGRHHESWSRRLSRNASPWPRGAPSATPMVA